MYAQVSEKALIISYPHELLTDLGTSTIICKKYKLIILMDSVGVLVELTRLSNNFAGALGSLVKKYQPP